MSLPANPKQAYGDLKPPVALVPASAILYMAQAFKEGARKYGPYNWRDKAVENVTYIAAAMRHLMAYNDGEELDPDSGNPHLAHAMACLAIIVDAQETGNLIEKRPLKGPASKVLQRMSKKPAVGVREVPMEHRPSDTMLVSDEQASSQAEQERVRQPCRLEDNGYCFTHFSYTCQHKSRYASEDDRRIGKLNPKFEHAMPDLDQEYPVCDCPKDRCASEAGEIPGNTHAQWTCNRLRMKDDQRFDVV